MFVSLVFLLVVAVFFDELCKLLLDADQFKTFRVDLLSRPPEFIIQSF